MFSVNDRGRTRALIWRGLKIGYIDYIFVKTEFFFLSVHPQTKRWDDKNALDFTIERKTSLPSSEIPFKQKITRF